MTARKCALTVLNRCTISGSWSVQTLDAELKRLESSTETLKGKEADREKALAARIVLGVLQNRILLDYYINALAARPEKLDMQVRNILRIGAYQLRFMDRIPNHAAVNEAVALCRESGFKSACGLVNAVLRKIAAGRIPEPEDISVRFSHPKWFTDRLIKLKGAAFAEAFLRADNEIPGTAEHTAFAPGETYVQDPAAYEAVRMAEPKPGMRVLDACAAPGGKSFTAAVLMENRGEILSCDIHEKKLRLVREGAERLGITVIRTFAADASVHLPELEEKFDLVIADVPCSGFGVIRKKPEIRYKTESEIAGLPSIQKRILRNVADYVRPGGTLLYSTCTVFPEENEQVVQKLLQRGGFLLRKEKSFYPNVDGTDGFYAAVLRRENGAE